MSNWPTIARMVSKDSPEVIAQRHNEYLTYYDASEADCTLDDLRVPMKWEWGGADCDANELNAIVADHLRDKLPKDHPLHFIVVGQFA